MKAAQFFTEWWCVFVRVHVYVHVYVRVMD